MDLPLGTPRCGNCQHKLVINPTELSKQNQRIACRRYPPTPVAFLMGTTPAVGNDPGGKPMIHQTMLLPVVQGEDYCGEHKFESQIVKA